MTERDLLLRRLGVVVALTAFATIVLSLGVMDTLLLIPGAMFVLYAVWVFRLTLDMGRFATDEEVRNACGGATSAVRWFVAQIRLW